MKNKLWLLQIPFVLLFTAFFLVGELGSRGLLKNRFLALKIYPLSRTVSGLFTNTKFHLRGPEAPKNKIVIVDIDGDSLARFGRWPWRRDITAALIQKSFDAGAKVVGLDVVFSEPNRQVSDEMLALLREHHLESRARDFETDFFLEEVIRINSSKLVLGWIPEIPCQTSLSSAEECPVSAPEIRNRFWPGMEKFAYQSFKNSSSTALFNELDTPLIASLNPIINIPIYSSAATHMGYFNADPDNDGYIRRTSLVILGNGKPYPPLSLEMARVGLGEELEIRTNEDSKVESITFLKSNRKIPVSPLGVMDINFRGPAYTFQYVSAIDVIGGEDQITVVKDGTPVSASKAELFKDAYALVGLSAVGVYDLRAFPFDSNTPGVEGHATILDNLLSNDMLWSGATLGPMSTVALLVLMTLGVLLFSYSVAGLAAIPGLLAFLGSLILITSIDLILFKNGINLNSGFLYLELLLVFMVTVASKYILEERKKRFIRGAFSKYVAPAIVDSILKDPTKLSVGGDRRELTILFSDIRGFTSFSEGMDAKDLTHFLNDYLGIMTDIVFECEGTLDKYIGDAVMAFWGAPLDQPKHAANAARAAVLMQKALRENHERFRKDYKVDVQIGIGMNTGVVSVGNMGSDRIFEYTCIGDHVNLASRLEGLTKYYGVGVVTSRHSFEAIERTGEKLPPHRVLDRVKVKGKQQEVELIQILDHELDPEGLRLFQEARALYEKRQWDDAILKFRMANERLSEGTLAQDSPSLLFVERCEELKISPPNADWKGSWEMQSK